jgi:hypothetical protein
MRMILIYTKIKELQCAFYALMQLTRKAYYKYFKRAENLNFLPFFFTGNLILLLNQVSIILLPFLR